MRPIIVILSLSLSLSLASCVNHKKNIKQGSLIRHCPTFNTASWTKIEVAQSQKLMFINKQKFAIPEDYKTLWFKSDLDFIGLCIVPDKRNRGSSYGCNSANVIYAKKNSSWQLQDQNVAICSN